MLAFWFSRWPSLSIGGSKLMPGVPRGTRITLSPSLPPRLGSVRATTTLRLAPRLSQPPELEGQYFLPESTYSPRPRSSVAVTPMPTGCGSGWSNPAVPPGLPAGSLTAQPARYSPVGSLVASVSHLRFWSSSPNQTMGKSDRPLTRRMQAKPGSTAQTSSATIWRSTLPTPPPPYSSGMNPIARPSL